ncbi:MAG TPA: sulfatase-like hydrolase/transferase [Terriglobales bacterium]|nr:sulfatase-like hydrolase/transferase [Terriglobales bacterium]
MKPLSLVGFCLVAIALGSAEAPRVKTSHPDIFLVTIDTLRADHVHCYGYDRVSTPALDEIARNGIRFTQAFTPSPITNTSHTTILTGLLPGDHGVTDFGVPLADTHSTLAELLHKGGYQTAAFIGAVILDSKSLAPGLDRGFDFYDNFPQHSTSKSRWGRVERRGMDVVQRAEKWLNAHGTGLHFVWIHLYDPHDPYEPPPPYSQKYKDHLYDGEIAYADSALEQFVGYLKHHGWYDRSIVAVVGDHGEGLGEHGEDTHGIFLYDSTTHVPLLMKLARLSNAGKTVDAQVRTTDILPTILDLAAIPVPEGLDGESLRPYFSGAGSDRTAFGETDYPLRFGWAPLRSVRVAGFKFIEAPRPELYDLHSDAQEAHNVYAPWDAHVQEFRKQMAELRSKLAKQPQASAGAVGKGTTDELRALGYLGAADALTSTTVPEPSLLPDPKDKIQEQNLVHTAMLATDNGRTGDARAALESVLATDPKSPTALLQLGELELDAGNGQKAADYLRRATEIRPDDAAAALQYARAMEVTGDLAHARDALDASLKLNPSQFSARLLMGQLCLRLQDPKAAEDQLEAALLLQPHNADAQVALARAMIAQKEFSDAANVLQSLVKDQRRNADVYDLLAQTYLELGENALAAQAQNTAKMLRAAQPAK